MANRQGAALLCAPGPKYCFQPVCPSLALQHPTAELTASPSSPTHAPADASPRTLPRREMAWIYTSIYKPGLFLFLQVDFPSCRFCDRSSHSFSFLNLNLFFPPHFHQAFVVFVAGLYSIHASYSGQNIMGAKTCQPQQQTM